MKKTLMLALFAPALLLAGCVVAPAYDPAYGPPPVAVVPAPAVVVQPYLYAHWGHYYRGPYYRHWH